MAQSPVPSGDAPVGDAGEASHVLVEGGEVVEAELVEAGVPARPRQHRHELRGRREEALHHVGVADQEQKGRQEHADQLGCDGIVMGSHGMGGVLGVLLGSTAQRVVHLANVPVTLVK